MRFSKRSFSNPSPNINNGGNTTNNAEPTDGWIEPPDGDTNKTVEKSRIIGGQIKLSKSFFNYLEEGYGSLVDIRESLTILSSKTHKLKTPVRDIERYAEQTIKNNYDSLAVKLIKGAKNEVQ